MADTLTGFSRPTFEELLIQSQADYAAATGVDVLVRRGIIPELPHMDARAHFDEHAHLDWIARQSHPLYATDWLDSHGRVWGVTRRAASRSSGGVDLTGTDGGVIPAGAVLVRDDGVRFVVTVGAVIVAGVASVTVQAEASGSDGNCVAGVALGLESPIEGVDSAAAVDGVGLVGGADVEADDDFRARILARIQQPPHGGNEQDYSAWVLAVAGVTRVWVSALEMGTGTVVIRFMMDDTYADGIPLAGDVDAVQAAVDAVRPVTAEVIVAAPVAVALDVTVSGLDPDTPAIRAEVEAELADLVLRRGAPGIAFRQSWLWEAVSLAAGEDSHAITVPAVDAVYDVGEIPVLGDVTYV